MKSLSVGTCPILGLAEMGQELNQSSLNKGRWMKNWLWPRRTQGLNTKFKPNLENGKPKGRKNAMCGIAQGNCFKIKVANSQKILQKLFYVVPRAWPGDKLLSHPVEHPWNPNISQHPNRGVRTLKKPENTLLQVLTLIFHHSCIPCAARTLLFLGGVSPECSIVPRT